MSATAPFRVGDRCMFLVQDRPVGPPVWVTGVIVGESRIPYTGFHVRRDASALVYFIAEEEVRSL